MTKNPKRKTVLQDYFIEQRLKEQGWIDDIPYFTQDDPYILRGVPYFDYGCPKELIRHNRDGDAGYDTYNWSGEDIYIKPNGIVRIFLGFGMKLPPHKGLFQSSRSGTRQLGLEVAFIPVDSNYTGGIDAIVTNHSDKTVVIENKSRFAQFVILDVYDLDFVDDVPENHPTERGANGFGSSGTGQGECYALEDRQEQEKSYRLYKQVESKRIPQPKEKKSMTKQETFIGEKEDILMSLQPSLVLNRELPPEVQFGDIVRDDEAVGMYGVAHDYPDMVNYSGNYEIENESPVLELINCGLLGYTAPRELHENYQFDIDRIYVTPQTGMIPVYLYKVGGVF